MSDLVEERNAHHLPGWLALPVLVGLAALAGWSIIMPLTLEQPPSVLGIICVPLLALLFKGFLILEPNQAGVMVFFGKYAGTVRADGFFWVNPLYKRVKVSLRAHNLNTPTLKVNDCAGNPIEVAAVIVWRVLDTARAVFDVEDYNAYVRMQSESAVRQVVSARWYDGDENGDHSLRSDLDTVARQLIESIQSHCALAGLEILEARISHLAYAAEIAGAMLRRQQAVAVVAARQEIVEGAVGMVKLALSHLEQDGLIEMDNAERVRLVSNLMTVLVGESETQPVIAMDHA
ncbi:MAG: SPFH domain-containing protein [Gammaproteobacteria bacterium]|nr:SPFH domain-containing protein [Gammaproteobacteria bacterium]